MGGTTRALDHITPDLPAIHQYAADNWAEHRRDKEALVEAKASSRPPRACSHHHFHTAPIRGVLEGLSVRYLAVIRPRDAWPERPLPVDCANIAITGRGRNSTSRMTGRGFQPGAQAELLSSRHCSTGMHPVAFIQRAFCAPRRRGHRCWASTMTSPSERVERIRNSEIVPLLYFADDRGGPSMNRAAR